MRISEYMRVQLHTDKKMIKQTGIRVQVLEVDRDLRHV